MKYEFMAAHASEYGIQRMCQALGVGRGGYYAWCKRPISQRELANQELLGQIKHVYQASRQTYGSPRIHAALQRQGMVCGRNRVARLMQMHRIAAKKRSKRHPVTTQRQPGVVPAPNLLAQDFSASAPNCKWVADITYIDTAEGWLYLAPVLDLYSRRVVGWAMADHMETSLVEAAFEMALARRHPPAGLLHHSDQGSQYTSGAYQQKLVDQRCEISMSRVGNCYDNAVMESFFSTVKTECADEPFPTRAIARTTIFEYLEVWYNRLRLHSSLGYRSPVEFEQQSRQ
jgi:putative transposase